MLINKILQFLTVVLISAGVSSFSIAAEKRYPVVTVASPTFIEMRTGPGRGYPLFYVVERDEKIEVLMRKTDWFKVRNEKGTKGWVSRLNLSNTLSEAGNLVAMEKFGLNEFEKSKWELGIQGGDFGGAPLVSGLLAYSLIKNISVEVNINEAVGNLSSRIYGGVSILNQPYPNWRASPFFGLGVGRIKTKLNKTLVSGEDRLNGMIQVEAGLRVYITRRFIFRLEYRNYAVLTNQAENDEIEEWKAGFGVFF